MAKALELHGTESEGRRIRVEEAGGPGGRPTQERDPTSTTIFVGGICYSSNEERIAAAFEDCGEIKDVRMPLNEEQTQVRLVLMYSFTNLIYLEPRILPR